MTITSLDDTVSARPKTAQRMARPIAPAATVAVASNRCISLWGSVFGHKYRPRFDCAEQPNMQVPTDPIVVLASRSQDVRDFYILKTQTYIGDICNRCGAIAARMERQGQ